MFTSTTSSHSSHLTSRYPLRRVSISLGTKCCLWGRESDSSSVLWMWCQQYERCRRVCDQFKTWIKCLCRFLDFSFQVSQLFIDQRSCCKFKFLQHTNIIFFFDKFIQCIGLMFTMQILVLTLSVPRANVRLGAILQVTGSRPHAVAFGLSEYNLDWQVLST